MSHPKVSRSLLSEGTLSVTPNLLQNVPLGKVSGKAMCLVVKDRHGDPSTVPSKAFQGVMFHVAGNLTPAPTVWDTEVSKAGLGLAKYLREKSRVYMYPRP